MKIVCFLATSYPTSRIRDKYGEYNFLNLYQCAKYILIQYNARSYRLSCVILLYRLTSRNHVLYFPFPFSLFTSLILGNCLCEKYNVSCSFQTLLRPSLDFSTQIVIRLSHSSHVTGTKEICII